MSNPTNAASISHPLVECEGALAQPPDEVLGKAGAVLPPSVAGSPTDTGVEPASDSVVLTSG